VKTALRIMELKSMVIPTLIFIAVDSVTLLSDRRWVGELGWTLEWANAGLYLASMVLAATSAYLSAPHLDDSFRTALQVRGVIASSVLFLTAWLRGLLVGLAGHGIVLGGALLWTASTSPTDAIRAESFVYALPPLLIFSALGAFVGIFFGRILAAGVAAALAFFLSYNAALSALSLPVMVGGYFATMTDVDYIPGQSQLFLASAAIIAVTIACAGVLALRGRGQRVATAGAVLIVALGVTVPSFTTADHVNRVEAKTEPISYVCDDDADLRVCVSAGHTTQLDAIADGVRTAAEPLRQAGAALPDELRETSLNSPDGDWGVLDIPGSDLNSTPLSDINFASAVTAPSVCNHQTNDLGLIKVGLTDWVAAQLDPASATPATERSDAWVQAAYTSLRDCTVDGSLVEGSGTTW
jgi:hypothetical protein